MYNNIKLLTSLLISAFSANAVFAFPAGDADSSSYSPHNSVSIGFMKSEPFKSDSSSLKNDYVQDLNLVNKTENKLKGLTKRNIEVSGVTRFLTIQRTMFDSYTDMTTSDNHISFSDYPNLSAGSGNAAGAGYPMLELNLKSQIKKDFNFNVGYSMGNNMTGQVDGSSRGIGAVQNLNFGAQMKTGMFKTSILIGEVLWTNLSKFTLGQPEFTDNYFERLPWDWYRSSFTRYQEYFTLSSNIGAQNLGRAPVQGGIGVIEHLPSQISFKVICGQTNRSIIAAVQGTSFPSLTQGYRLEKYIFERAIRGKTGINLYAKRAKVDYALDLPDNNTMYTFDFDVKVKKIKFEGELGGSQIKTIEDFASQNFDEVSGDGFGGYLKTSFDRRAVLWPFSIEFYQLTKNFGNVDGSVLNQNPYVKQGGARNEFLYNDSYFANISQEVGQMTNNRRGVNLDIEANFGDFKVQFGYSASQEIEALTDTLTIQHRVNSFSRSRFRPWYQAGGEYGRIKSYWFRTFETVTLSNDSGFLQRDLLGFNAIEMMLKYKKPIGKKQEIVLLNLSTFNSIKDGFNAFSFPGEKDNLVSVLYNDFTAAYKLNRKMSLVGNFAVEVTKGSDRTAVEHTDLESAETKVDYIDQLGNMYAIGIDYDLSRKTSFHLRTKYMTHVDKNFKLDTFSGLETTFELKIFL
ncbi:MAG: hypothetical protein CMD18_01435 [Flavobacteriales bacterium]|nr:hypothetical protein [Flavobacteriales bacterium]